MASFEVLPWNIPKGTEKNDKNSYQDSWIRKLRFEPVICQI
jgi:hypothetical protein